MAARGLRAAALVLVLCCALGGAGALSDAAQAYRNACAPYVPPEGWDVEEDGPYEAPEGVKRGALCPHELTESAWSSHCARHLPPPGWDEDEDGEFVADAGELSTCVVLFVPHVLDTGAAGRMDLLGQLMQAAKKASKRPLVFFWSAAGAQPDLETVLDVGMFPKLAVYSPRREAAAVMPQAFTVSNVDDFLLRAAVRNVGARPVTIPSVASPEEWDHQDAPPPTCEDESYDDIELEGF